MILCIRFFIGLNLVSVDKKKFVYETGLDGDEISCIMRAVFSHVGGIATHILMGDGFSEILLKGGIEGKVKENMIEAVYVLTYRFSEFS